MEIAEIQKAGSLVGIQKKGGVQHTQPLDRLSISSESEKKALWVEMLKEMPDLRTEKVEAARATPSTLELARKIIDHI